MLSQLLEDAYSDKQARKNAEMAFDAIIENLKSKNKQSYTPRGSGELYVLDSAALVLRGDISPFKFVLKEPAENELSKIKVGYNVKQKAIIVMMDLNTDWQSQLQTIKSKIVHQFIRHLDASRSNGSTENKPQPTTKQEYYKSDSKLNAYYQEAIHEFEKLYSKMYASNSFETFRKFTDRLNTFDAFRDTLITFADQQFISNLTPENEKRLTKRLYGYYTDVFLQDVNDKIYKREH